VIFLSELGCEQDLECVDFVFFFGGLFCCGEHFVFCVV